MPSEKRVRVAVVGGGCGALSAAFELTRPEQGGRYEVTVYQTGWRLGGKGASGRGNSWRIEEHALHVWLGFYENAFRMLRDCHAELGTPEAWRNDFIEDSFIALARDAKGGAAAATAAAAWAALFPPTPGLPGDPLVGDRNPFALASYLRQALRLLRSLLGGLAFLEKDPDRGFVDKDFLALDPGPDPEDQRNAVKRALEAMLRMWKLGFLSSTAGILTSINLIEQLILSAQETAMAQRAAESQPPAQAGPKISELGPDSASRMAGDAEQDRYVTVEFVKAFADAVRAQLSGVVQSDPKFSLRWQIIDLVLAIMVGAVRDGLLTHPDGLDSINDQECSDWLRKHGASEEAVTGPFVTGLYRLGFAEAPDAAARVAKEAGNAADDGRKGVAAGQALRGALRMFFTYRGAMFWKMRAGMGDVVFSPLYNVLRNRGVRFEFFHRLEKMDVTDPADMRSAPFVSSLRFDVQADLAGRDEYAPLVRFKERDCWPSHPDWAQLQGGDAGSHDFESFYDRHSVKQVTLQVARDFDFVVLGIGKGAIPYVCDEFLKGEGPISAKWSLMVEKVPTVSTQSFQVWLRASMADFGWHDESVTLTGIPGHFDTWADMRQVVPAEGWPEGMEPRSVAYFCGPLLPHAADNPEHANDVDPEHPSRRRREVRDNALQFLNTRMVELWRGAGEAGAFRWNLLVNAADPGSVHTDANLAIDSQFVAANINPSDQYVLAPPGSIQYRISPLDTGIDNLTVAGDWTACGFTEGCVEAAVMSGRLASHAISLLPKLEDIVGYDHP